MDKLQELNAIADNLEMSVENEGTEDKESFCVYKDGKVVAKGSYLKIKTKLEDLTYEQGMEAKIKELIDAGKSDEEIVKIISLTPDNVPGPDGGPMAEDLFNDTTIKEKSDTFAEDFIKTLNSKYAGLEITDVAVDSLKAAMKEALENWYTRNIY